MTPERLIKILQKVVDRHTNLGEYDTQINIFNDVRAVLRGLSKTENFLANVSVKGNDIVVSNPEDIPYISFIPYMYKVDTCSDNVYFIYLDNKQQGYDKLFMCAIQYEDNFNNISPSNCFGIGIKIVNMPLGAYDYINDIFVTPYGDRR